MAGNVALDITGCKSGSVEKSEMTPKLSLKI